MKNTQKESSIFDGLILFDHVKAFENAIKKGMKNPEDYMYMYSTKFRDYFKHIDTRRYTSYFNLGNIFNYYIQRRHE